MPINRTKNLSNRFHPGIEKQATVLQGSEFTVTARQLHTQLVVRTKQMETNG